jgi:hypothetical protein
VVYLPGGEVEGSELILFNRFTQRLLTYDPATFSVTGESNAENFLQYAFPTLSDYFTAGNSAGTDFRVVRVSGGTVQTVLELPDGQGVFPLATDGERVLFTRSTYDDASREVGRVLVSLEEGALVEDPRISEPVDSGAIVGDRLYYTSYVDATTDYELRVVSLTDDAPPALLASGLESGRLFAHDGQVFTSTQDRLVNGDQSFDCVELCWFQDELGILLRMRVGEQAGLALDVLDIRTQEVLETRNDIIDFAVEDDTVVIYRSGGIDRIDVGGRS